MGIFKNSEETKTDEKTPLINNRRLAIIGTALAVVLAMSGYATGRAYCANHFPPGSIVCGLDASWMTADELASELESSVAAYQTKVTGDDIDLTLSAADLGMSIDARTVAQRALAKSNASAWPLGLFSKTAIATGMDISVDRQMAADAVADAVWTHNQTATSPTNAQVVYDEDQQTFVTEPEQLGTLLDADAVTNAIVDDALVLEEKTELNDDQLARPDVLSDSPALASACDKANKMATLSVPLTFEGKEVCTVTAEQIQPAITFDYSYGNVTPTVDFDSLWNWCYATLNDLVNGETETRVWEVNSWETANNLVPHIEALDSSPLEVSTITIEERPAESEGHEQYGRHIDVNITTQYARLYDTDGKTVLWRSPIVSGNPNTGYGTAQGWFTMDWRDENITLYGPEDPETHEPEWASPVRWWMGFYANSDGFHDADWRSEEEFGGDTYLYAGSHGCVNLPIEKAHELWDLTDYGEKVYVHE